VGSRRGAPMIAWMAVLFVSPLLAGFAFYLCRGPREDRRLAREQIAEWQILAEIERHENLH
jgi:hypothetical protein